MFLQKTHALQMGSEGKSYFLLFILVYNANEHGIFI